MAVGLWGIPPSEFWDMAPIEWWWLHDLKRRQQTPDVLTHDDIGELRDFAAATHAQDQRTR